MALYWKDIRYLKFPKKYGTTQGKDADYWHKVSRNYYNFEKRVDTCGWHWYVITFKDGRKELAYLKVHRAIIPHGGRLCRGLIFPRYWGVDQYEHTKEITLAF